MLGAMSADLFRFPHPLKYLTEHFLELIERRYCHLENRVMSCRCALHTKVYCTPEKFVIFNLQ